jgi:ornithine carbamoyltransferase
VRHFLDLHQLDGATLRAILEDARAMKANPALGNGRLAGKTLAMLFEKSSTRTRVSFEVGMKQLGGHTVVLKQEEMQLKRGETVADTARVLSRYVDAIMIRTGPHAKLLDLAEYGSVPVINALTDVSHPCQIMADIMTFEEHRGPIAGRTVAWVGDANNVCTSWIHAAVRFGFELRIGAPASLAPEADLVAWARREGAKIVVTTQPASAVAGADLVTTDTWVSMGQDAANRHFLLAAYQVDSALMEKARPDAIFMHCLPAHRGEEVTEAVLDGPQSVVWDEAENRLHVQKGILAWCLS